MTHDYKYSLGIYVNDWSIMIGSKECSHAFLGLTLTRPDELDKDIEIEKYSNLRYLYRIVA